MTLLLALLLSLLSLVGSPLPACATEDIEGSSACYWDAVTRSNGQGENFIWTGSQLINFTR